jgi:hypothetical protein
LLFQLDGEKLIRTAPGNDRQGPQERIAAPAGPGTGAAAALTAGGDPASSTCVPLGSCS